jgi:eukaryotic-like serine/threonine-protein kinase
LFRLDHFLQGFLELHRLKDPQERRSVWRSSLASVARACSVDAPNPLEGIAPAALVESVQTALSSGLVDHLDWLSPESAAAALYEVAAALPPGNEKRELGRRIFTRLVEGNAQTFVALSTRMALGSGKGLRGEGIRARIALVCSMPPSFGVRSEALAIALMSRRELAREWAFTNSTGSLPDRRLAGRLIEQASTSIARKAAQGDEGNMRVFRGDAFAQTMSRLLADREMLVWRHVAVARGLLAKFHRPYWQEIEDGNSLLLTPTEWRRSATSLVASAAFQPEVVVRAVRDVIARGILVRDPGAIACFLYGIPAVADCEPECAEELLDFVVSQSPVRCAEALLEILPMCPGGTFGSQAVQTSTQALSKKASSSVPPSNGGIPEEGLHILKARLLKHCEQVESSEFSLVDANRKALRAFAEQGARVAHSLAIEALEMAGGSIDTLEALDETPDNESLGIVRRTSVAVLRDIDDGMLVDGTMRDLLFLGHRLNDAGHVLSTYEKYHDRVAEWLIDREGRTGNSGSVWEIPGLHLKLIQTLLHIADARAPEDSDDGPLAQRARHRYLRIVRIALKQLAEGPPKMLHRALCAVLARAADALMRDGVCEPSDILLVFAWNGLHEDDFATLHEASMSPEFESLLAAYVEMLHGLNSPISSHSEAVAADGIFLLTEARAATAPNSLPSLAGQGHAGQQTAVLSYFANVIDTSASSRTAALRNAAHRLSRALGMVLAARGLDEVAGSDENSPLQSLENAVSGLTQLCSGARQRLNDAIEIPRFSLSGQLSAAVDGAVQSGKNEGVFEAVSLTRMELEMLIPDAFATIISAVLQRLPELPVFSTSQGGNFSSAEFELPLPPWMPSRRTLGGFYVVRSLGSGTGGTVFVVRRIEDRHESKAERFALKVPDYNGNAARTLSEGEFLQMFREEAGALLSLPHHQNLAKFVTFDLATRPKPILVMELVEGISLERLIASGELDTNRVFDLIDGMLSGLASMHKVGVGHLDVKPTNVIVRDSKIPVLVDFGLSGRHIRPGCGTGPYGAPEVWGVYPSDSQPSPMQADVYSLACVAFELLTNQLLIDAPHEMAFVTAHITHDGWPARLQQMAAFEELRPIAELLSKALRHDSRQRLSVLDFQQQLRNLRPYYKAFSWPLFPQLSASLN